MKCVQLLKTDNAGEYSRTVEVAIDQGNEGLEVEKRNVPTTKDACELDALHDIRGFALMNSAQRATTL